MCTDPDNIDLNEVSAFVSRERELATVTELVEVFIGRTAYREATRDNNDCLRI